MDWWINSLLLGDFAADVHPEGEYNEEMFEEVEQ